MSQGPVLDVATARIVVSAAVAVGTFYVEAHAAVHPLSVARDFEEVPV